MPPLFNPGVEAKIRQLVADDDSITPARIELALSLDPDTASLRIPERKTLARRIRALRPRDPGEPWHLAEVVVDPRDLSPQDLTFVVRVLRETRSRRQVRGLTKREVQWIVRIGRARQNFGEWLAYRFARRYIAAEDAGESTDALDGQLATVNPIAELLPDEELDKRARHPGMARAQREQAEQEAQRGKA